VKYSILKSCIVLYLENEIKYIQDTQEGFAEIKEALKLGLFDKINKLIAKKKKKCVIIAPNYFGKFYIEEYDKWSAKYKNPFPELSWETKEEAEYFYRKNQISKRLENVEI
jgi:hypothetical protein